MADYSRVEDFSAKDALATGDPEKKITGADVDSELDAVVTAVATKADKIGGGTDGAIVTQNASGNITDSGRTVTGLIGGANDTELTISSGSVTPTSSFHNIDTESDASTDDLSNIVTTNTPEGTVLILIPNSGSRDIVVKDAATGAGEIHLIGDTDYTLRDVNEGVILQREGADWFERGRFGHPTPELLASGNIGSPQSAWQFESSFLSTQYRVFELYITGFVPSADADTLQSEVHTDGSTWITTSSYSWIQHYSFGTSTSVSSSASDTHAQMTGSPLSNVVTENLNGKITIYATDGEDGDTYPSWNWHFDYTNSTSTYIFQTGSARLNSADTLTGFRILCDSSTIAKMKYAFYGLK